MRLGAILTAGVAAAAVLVVVSGPPSAAAADGAECTEPVAGAPNMAVIPSSSSAWAKLRGTTHVNGSVGFVQFWSVTRNANHTLVGPDGTEYGPRVPVAERLVFPEVGLCATGTWTLRHDPSGDVVAEFAVAWDPDGPSPRTPVVVIDHAFDGTTERTYQAGELYGEAKPGLADARANWTGPVSPEGYRLVEPSPVAFSAAYDVRVDAGGEAIVSVCTGSEGEADRRCRAERLVGPAECAGCSISVPAAWKAGATYHSRIEVFAWQCAVCPVGPSDYDDGYRDLVPEPSRPSPG